MMTNFKLVVAGIEITEAAYKKICSLIKSKVPDFYLRLGIKSGGCEGFQYHFEFENGPITKSNTYFYGTDESFAKIVIDNKSAKLFKDVILDCELPLPKWRGF